MKIYRTLNFAKKIKNRKISSFFYKIGKLYINCIYPLTNKKNNVGVSETSNIVVSLTTIPERIDTVWLTVNTILNQTVKPKKVILWLSQEQFKDKDLLPEKLLNLQNKGLTIAFCDDLKPHKKYYYTLKEYPNSTLITVDDDIFYPENLIEKLIETSKKYPNSVCCTWGHEVTFNDFGEIAPYSEWKKGVNDCRTPSHLLMPVGCGGVLYPPHIFEGTALLNKVLIKKLCLYTDDLWLKSMAVLNDIKAVRVDEDAKIYFSILRTQNRGLHYSNVGKNKNDEALRKILDEFPNVQKSLYMN
ncbi:hypothetical protein IHQ11_15140 [Priestia megaterium]|uniref:hypothetical protein n=1 Tax=Priestia megaterium TaxID=1404 RepID=UPI001B3A3AA6|nr:hypothetical protein [Priestia megaterium]MBQ4867833.1 hypothetical protein [Priestia megaterium]